MITSKYILTGRYVRRSGGLTSDEENGSKEKPGAGPGFL
jgi:hypothetical protein